MSATMTRLDVRERVHIPPEIAEAIAAFLNAGRTGTIQLDVSRGKVGQAKIIETVRVRANPCDVDRDARSEQD